MLVRAVIGPRAGIFGVVGRFASYPTIGPKVLERPVFQIKIDAVHLVVSYVSRYGAFPFILIGKYSRLRFNIIQVSFNEYVFFD